MIDKGKWDACIDQSFNGIIYAYSWYLDIVSENWEGLVEDDYKRVMPLTSRSKLGFHYLYQPAFTQQLGVFSSTEDLSEKVILNFLMQIPAKYKLIEVNLNAESKVDHKELYLRKYKTEEYLTHYLDLNKDYESLRKGYSKNIVRNIQKSKGAEIQIEKNNNVLQLIDLFKQNKGREIRNLKKDDYKNLNNLVSFLILQNIAEVWNALTSEKELCAGIIFITYHNKAIFLFSAISEKAKNTGAMAFLIDSFIRENAKRNLVLDFEGSNIPGLKRFYKSFGAEEIKYIHLKKNMLPWYISWFK